MTMKMTDSAFFNDYAVDYSDVDEKRTLRPSHLLDFLQDVAVTHSDQLGFDLDYFEREQIGWALLRWHIQISRWPHEGEQLTLSTWCEEYRRIRANRNFAIADSSGEEICYAASRWALMNMAGRRPARPQKDFLEPYKFPRCRGIPAEDFAMPKAPRREPDSVRLTEVTRRDKDTNGHTNNAVYLDWSTDSLSDGFYLTHTIRDIRIAYQKEAMQGMKIKIRTWREGDLVISLFTDAEKDSYQIGSVCTQWAADGAGRRG